MNNRIRFNFFLLVAFIAFQPVSWAQGGTQSRFRASVVKIDVTPDKPKQLLGYGARVSTGVHDRIYHRIIAMDDGVNRFFLVSSDFCVMAPSQYDHTAALLQKKFGIDPLNFWWSLTHTHSAPEVGPPGLPEVFMGERYKHPVDTAYTRHVENLLIDGIAEAIKKLEPARLGVGWGFAMANINRRAVQENGKATLGLNLYGAVDRRIGLIRLEKENGSPIALISNYAIHATVLGAQNTEISSDVAGIVSEYVEQKIGAPVLFINGAAGNIGPIYSVYPNARAGHLNEYKVILGDKIVDANKRLSHFYDTVKIFTGKSMVESPRREGLDWPEYLGDYTRTTKDGVNIIKLPIRFLKLTSDIAIWSAPLELFCEISNDIRDRSPFQYTMYYGYTNGWLGYLPNEDAWKYGGYEVEMVSPFTSVIQRDITETVLGYLEGEMNNPQPPSKQSRRKQK